MSFALRFHFAHEIEISAVLHGVEQRSSLRALIGHEHRGRQMSRIGIDRVTEQRELNQRNAEHHGESEAVTTHLQKFFRDDPAQTCDRKFRMPVHDADSFLPSN